MIDLGWFGLFIGFFVNVPQIQRIIKKKSAHAVSMRTFLILSVVQLFYLTHSLSIKDAIYIISNLWGLLTSLIVLILAKHYGNHIF